jgi:hypothetical protein
VVTTSTSDRDAAVDQLVRSGWLQSAAYLVDDVVSMSIQIDLISALRAATAHRPMRHRVQLAPATARA